MSDEQEVPNEDDLVHLLQDEAYLKENGFRLTPKGIMALVMMEFDCPKEIAAQISQIMSDRIFNAGYTYLDNQQIGISDFPDFLGDADA